MNFTPRFLKPRLFLAALTLALLAGSAALAFSSQWSTHFTGSGDLGQFDRYLIGDCSGQNHSVSNSSVHMRAAYGTDCFGAYYRDNNNHPNTFPTDQDVRVAWRWRYSGYEKYGTQAGQVTSAYGVVQYYGMSGVDTTGAGGNTNFPHVVTSGPWGSNGVDNPLWRGSAYDTSWHTSTFDFICDGTQLTWWLDSGKIHTAAGPARPAGDPYRPYQFWFGNLLTDTPSNGDWTGFDLDHVHIYAVERPQMNIPVPGGGGTQAVTWNAVPNTPQPDGSTWSIEYEAQVCPDPNCTNPVGSSGWQAGTSYTFSGLEANRTYYYRVRARWVGAPELVTCWGNTVSAEQAGVPELRLAKNATVEAGPGEVISYSLILQNSGSAGASGVVVRDPVPPYLSNPDNISSGGSLNGNEVVWQIGALGAGESRTLSWQGTVAGTVPASVSQITNVATAADDAGHTAQAQAATTVLVPGLSLAKSAPAEVKPGEGVSYSLTLANTGNMTLRQVVVRDPLPQYLLNPAGVSHGGRLNGSEVVWEIGDLTAGESLVLAWRATVDPLIPVGVTELLNRATVTTQIGLTAEAQAASRVLQPQMRVTKSALEKVMPGQEITYTLTISNAGSVTLYQVRLEDPLPAYVTPVPYGIADGGYEVPGRIVWDNLGDIPPGQSRAVSWRGTVDPLIPPEVYEIRNIAVATAGGGLTETGEALSEVLQPGLALVKEASATAYAGGEIAYYLHLSNNGPGLARFIEVRDPLPAYIFFVPDVAPSINNYGTLEGSEVVWRLNELGPGETVTLRWRAQVNLDVPAGVDTIPNEASATSLEAPNPVLAQASTRLLDPGLRLSHTCPTLAQAGDVLTYTVRVENGSSGVARSAVVRAPVPAGLSYVPGSATSGGRLVGDPAQAPYWNAAGLIETGLPPLFLKENLRLIEAALGRVRGPGAIPGQIPIDLDLVLYGQSMVDLGRRPILDPAIYHDPHVALPLADLAPDWVHPESGETLAAIAQQLNFSDKEIYKVDMLPLATAIPTGLNGHGQPPSTLVCPDDPPFEGLVRQILTHLGEDATREGLQRTPLRVAKALDFLTAGYRLALPDVINGALFEVEGDGEMVIVKDIEFYSLCEHHLLPFFGKAHIGYLPNGKIIGLSKVARIVDVFARRLQVQERLTGQVADALMEVLDARGVAVVLEASHFCMMMRGVQKQHSSTVTNAMRGVFQSDPGKREEFARLRQR